MFDTLSPPAPLGELAASPELSRRGFLKGALGLAGLAALPFSANAEGNFWEKPRELWLFRSQTRENVKLTYWKDGAYDTQGYVQACELLRDVNDNKAVQMDPVLLDIMRGMQAYYQAYGYNYPFVINSGFRTERTNRKLLSEGAARNSMHLYGKAVDLYMPNIPVKHLGQMGLYFHQGGVGFYEGRGFVHIDTGNLRVWRG